jgi:hypothetical protein
LGSRIIRHGVPHPAAPDVVRVAGKPVGREGRVRGAASLPESAAVRPLRQLERSGRPAGDAALANHGGFSFGFSLVLQINWVVPQPDPQSGKISIAESGDLVSRRTERRRSAWHPSPRRSPQQRDQPKRPSPQIPGFGPSQEMPCQSLPATAANALRLDEQKLNLSPRRLAAQAIESGNGAAFVEDIEGAFRNGLRVYGQRGAACFHEGGIIAPQCLGPQRKCAEVRSLTWQSATRSCSRLGRGEPRARYHRPDSRH